MAPRFHANRGVEMRDSDSDVRPVLPLGARDPEEEEGGGRESGRRETDEGPQPAVDRGQSG